METANMRTLPPDGSSDDRSVIDEALFAQHAGYFPSGAPEVPADVVLGALAPAADTFPESPDQVGSEVPSWLRFAPDQEPGESQPCGAVRDGGAEYQMTGLAPGLFELRVVTPPSPTEPTVED